MIYQLNDTVINALAKYIAPKEEVRYYLMGVQVEFTPDRIIYVATDGNILAAYAEPYGSDETPINRQLIIPREVALKKRIKAKIPLKYDIRDGKKHAIINYFDAGIPFSEVEGVFPNWRNVIPQKISGEMAYYNPDLLAKISSAYKAIYEQDVMAYPLQHNGRGPGIMTNGLGFLTAIMPYLAEDPQSIPAWALAPAEEKPKARRKVKAAA